MQRLASSAPACSRLMKVPDSIDCVAVMSRDWKLSDSWGRGSYCSAQASHRGRARVWEGFWFAVKVRTPFSLAGMPRLWTSAEKLCKHWNIHYLRRHLPFSCILQDFLIDRFSVVCIIIIQGVAIALRLILVTLKVLQAARSVVIKSLCLVFFSVHIRR